MSSQSSVMGPTVVTLGGDPEVASQSSVMGPTVVTWVGTLRCPVSPVWWVLL